MRSRTRWYTDELIRTSTAKLKIELGPTKWRNTSVVHLAAEGYEAEVRIVDVPCETTHGGSRRFLVCPSCGSERCTTLAVFPGEGWRCRSCGGWRGRERRRIISDGPVSASEFTA
jgi:hypothetical protein